MPSRPPPAPRLCLVTPALVEPQAFAPLLDGALAAAEIASLIVGPGASSPAAVQRIGEIVVPIAQARGVAVLIPEDTRIAGRVGADGVHVEAGLEALADALASFRGKRIVGAGNLTSRHDALAAGELEPDYVFFGRLDGDNAELIHPAALDLAAWWSGLIEIPAIVMGGSSLASLAEAVGAGVDFVALRDAVWRHPAGPAAAVAEAAGILSGSVEVTA